MLIKQYVPDYPNIACNCGVYVMCSEFIIIDDM